MKCTLAIATTMLLVAVFNQPAQQSQSVRRIGIPAREYGYKNFETQVIESQAKLDTFLKQIERQAWNDRPDFVKGIQDAKIDFAKECLALIRYGPVSSSVGVRFLGAEIKGETLVCSISRSIPIDQTSDSNYNCYALALPKGKIKLIEVWHQAYVLELDGK